MPEIDQTPTAKTAFATLATAPRRDSLVKARTLAVREMLHSGDSCAKQVADHPMDVMTLSREERNRLLTGRKISIVVDSHVTVRKNVPVRALLAMSTKFCDLLHVKPDATQFRIYHKTDRKSIERLLDIFTTPALVDATEIKLISTSFVEDLLMYEACLSLGVYHAHIKPLLNALCAEISARLLTVEEMNTIANRAAPTDPLFKHLANSLCHRRFKKEIPDILAFERWLSYDKKMALKTMMMEIDQGHKKRRAQFKANFRVVSEKVTPTTKGVEEGK
jgi:hypothetical protein